MHAPITCMHLVLYRPCVVADKAKSDDKVEADDVAISMDQTQDASKLGRHVAPGESSSSSSSSSSDGQAEHNYFGMHSPASSCCSHCNLHCGNLHCGVIRRCLQQEWVVLLAWRVGLLCLFEEPAAMHSFLALACASF